jgi:hypothetical protein
MAYRFQDSIEAEADYRAVSRNANQGMRLLDGMALDIVTAAKRIALAAPQVDGQNLTPSAERLAILMVEAIDGELSGEAWCVVNAEVRAAFVRAHRELVAA